MHLSSYLKQSPRGEAARIARALGVPPSHVCMWAKGVRPVPPMRAVALEKETFGRVHRCDMRQDWTEIWPDLIPLRSQLKQVAA